MVRVDGSWLNVAGRGGLAVALVVGTAGAQTTVPDAQVEANVLKALASAPELANEQIQTRTVYGTVTLSGTVADETLRSRAETLAANAKGVKKVVDELTLGQAQAASNDQGTAPMLQSDGTLAPVSPAAPGAPQAADVPNPAAGVTNPQRNNPDADQALDQQANPQGGQPQAQANNGQYPPPQGQYPNQGQYPQQYPNQGQAQGQYPQPYPNQQYPNQPGPYGYPSGRQPMGAMGYGQPQQMPSYAGQVAGKTVTIPGGAVVDVRITERLASNHSLPGDVFHGVVLNDVMAGSAVAIPRGAAVQGKVVSATPSGSLSGRGEMSIQLTQLMLGGQTYPLVSDTWEHAGPDKTLETVNRAVGLGAVGAIIGAVAGGGAGAAIGGGVGAAAGIGSSAASGKGQVVVPSEATIAFHVAQPTQVTTVSQDEMQRLAYGVPYVGPRPGAYPVAYPGYYYPRRYPYYPPPPPPGYYYGPGYYYRPY